jgi:hypothetical protein
VTVQEGAAPTATPTPAATPAPVVTPTPAPKPLAKASFELPASGRGSATFSVNCAAVCTATGTLTADAGVARRIGFKTLGAKTATLRAGVTKLKVALSSKALRALRRHKVKSVTTTLKVTARYGAGASATKSRRVKISL